MSAWQNPAGTPTSASTSRAGIILGGSLCGSICGSLLRGVLFMVVSPDRNAGGKKACQAAVLPGHQIERVVMVVSDCW
jgi:hypothetical protein